MPPASHDHDRLAVLEVHTADHEAHLPCPVLEVAGGLGFEPMLSRTASRGRGSGRVRGSKAGLRTGMARVTVSLVGRSIRSLTPSHRPHQESSAAPYGLLTGWRPGSDKDGVRSLPCT